jgi:hypothetical protein
VRQLRGPDEACGGDPRRARFRRGHLDTGRSPRECGRAHARGIRRALRGLRRLFAPGRDSDGGQAEPGWAGHRRRRSHPPIDGHTRRLHRPRQHRRFRHRGRYRRGNRRGGAAGGGRRHDPALPHRPQFMGRHRAVPWRAGYHYGQRDRRGGQGVRCADRRWPRRRHRRHVGCRRPHRGQPGPAVLEGNRRLRPGRRRHPREHRRGHSHLGHRPVGARRVHAGGAYRGQCDPPHRRVRCDGGQAGWRHPAGHAGGQHRHAYGPGGPLRRRRALLLAAPHRNAQRAGRLPGSGQPALGQPPATRCRKRTPAAARTLPRGVPAAGGAGGGTAGGASGTGRCTPLGHARPAAARLTDRRRPTTQ